MSLKQNVNTVSGLTASTTQTQAGALQLDQGITLSAVTTVGTAADAVKLPQASPGKIVFVTNGAAANSMGVFPASGDTVNALAANAVYALAANKTALFIASAAGQWRTILTA